MCEIGEEVGYPGQIKQVKILGTMALLDEGETDWKIIAIDINDPLASKLNDIEDVERHLPGLLRATNEFWRIYKVITIPIFAVVADGRFRMENRRIRLRLVGSVRIRSMRLRSSRNVMRHGNVLLPVKLNLPRASIRTASRNLLGLMFQDESYSGKLPVSR